MPKAKAEKQDTAPEQQAVPIVMTLAQDYTFPDKASASAACYSWSKDGAAASTAQWSLPPQNYDVVLNWILDAAGTTQPVDGTSFKTYTYNSSGSTANPITPHPVWANDGDGTYSSVATGTCRETRSSTGAVWDARVSGSNSLTTEFPITLKAGSTCTLTPVLAAAPAVHTIQNITPTSFQADWAAGPNRDVEVDGVVVGTSATNQSMFQVNGLTPGTTYQTRTRVNDGTNPVSEWTAAVPATTTTTPAAPPVHTFSDITPTQARVSWSPSGIRDTEVDGVIVKTSTSGQFISNLLPATTYSTRTRADNPESEWTAAVPLTTLAKYPAPEAPTFTGIAPTEFVVHWTPTGKRNIYVNGTRYASNSNSGYRVTSRTPGTTYSVTTEQVDGNTAISEKSAAGSVTTTAPPPVPTGVTVSEIDTTGFTVSCDAMPGATAYEVRTTVVEGAP